jgi:hypothetical protein
MMVGAAQATNSAGTVLPQTCTVGDKFQMPGQVIFVCTSTNYWQLYNGRVAMTSGTSTTDDCAKFDAFGSLVDAGAACGSGGGGSSTGSGIQYGDGAGGFLSMTAMNGDCSLNLGTGAITCTKPMVYPSAGRVFSTGLAWSTITPRSISSSGNAVLSDNMSTITSTGSSATVVTIPNDSSVAWPVGSILTIYQSGIGVVSFAGDGTSTVVSPGGTVASAQQGTVQAYKVAANSWAVVGQSFPITSGTAPQKANGSGGLSGMTAGIDYQPAVLFQTGQPIGLSNTGSIDANGVYTNSTTMDQIYSGIWLYFMANQIKTGASPAGFYWAVCSSTTVCQIYTNTYVPGTTTWVAPGSPTAFTSTNNTSVTGASGTITALQVTVPANTLGANGSLKMEGFAASSHAAGTDTVYVDFGGTHCFSSNGATVYGFNVDVIMQNQAATGKQTCNGSGLGSLTDSVANLFPAIDTTIDEAMTVSLVPSAATKFMAIKSFSIISRPHQ